VAFSGFKKLLRNVVKRLGFISSVVVCTFLREVSLVISKGKLVVLELIAAKAGVRCI